MNCVIEGVARCVRLLYRAYARFHRERAIQMLPDTEDFKPVVLCIDDDEAILNMEKMALECDGYAVLTADNGSAALDAFCFHAIDAVVLDYDMPGMNGGEIAAAMKRLNPKIPKLLFSGRSAIPAEVEMLVEGFCSKTAGIRALLSHVRGMVHQVPFQASSLDHRFYSPESR
ncbi:MAG: response regulator [Candidatus Korobacteraceae bacterium]